MKAYLKKIIISALIIFAVFSGSTCFADAPPPPPPPGGGHGQGGNHGPGGGAPVGEGIFITSILGLAYGARKWNSVHKKP